MNKSHLQKTSLRFKQWSRKAYAAFKSVGRHVTIGSLKNVVADALLGKQKNSLNTFTITREKENGFCITEWNGPPPEELQETLIPVIPAKKSYDRNVENAFPVDLLYMAESCFNKTLSAFFIYSIKVYQFNTKQGFK